MKRKIFLLIIAVFLCTGCLCTGCTGQIVSEPVVTEDVIVPDSTADTVVEMAQEAENVPYIWFGESLEEAKRILEHVPSLRYSGAELEAEVEKQQSYGATVTAQEVANLVGAIMVENYNLQYGTIMPYDMQEEDYSFENLPPISMQIVENFDGKIYWEVMTNYADLYANTLETYSGTFTIDAMNMEIAFCSFHSGFPEIIAEMESTPIDPAFIVNDSDNEAMAGHAGRWDNESPEFQNTLDKKITELKENIEGSPILQGANILEIKLGVWDEEVPEKVYDFLPLVISLDDGRVVKFYEWSSDALYSQYNVLGSPLWNASFTFS